jgi:hypothetical protein
MIRDKSAAVNAFPELRSSLLRRLTTWARADKCLVVEPRETALQTILDTGVGISSDSDVIERVIIDEPFLLGQKLGLGRSDISDIRHAMEELQ